MNDKNFELLDQLLIDLKHTCRKPDAPRDNFLDVDAYDVTKGNQLLEIFALEIQMCIDTKEQLRMKKIYNLTQKFTAVIEDPRVVGIIKECGGKMYMSEKRWTAALEEFRASFQSLVESGNQRA